MYKLKCLSNFRKRKVPPNDKRKIRRYLELELIPAYKPKAQAQHMIHYKNQLNSDLIINEKRRRRNRKTEKQKK